MSRTPGEDDRLLAMMAARLRARTDDLIAQQLRVLRGLHSYDRVPEEDLRRSCRRNVLRVVATLEQSDQLPAEVEEDERVSGHRRALQGVPSQAVVEAYRAVLAVLRDAFLEEATAASMDAYTVLAATRRLWDLTDRFSNVLVSARQQVEIDSARRDERQRMAFLQRLLVGNVDPDELVAGGAVHGVLPDRQYWVLRGREHAARSQRLSRHLESAPASARPLVALIDDDVAGISTVRPRPLEAAVIAVAGPVTLAEVPHAFTEATRVLNVALRYGRTGVVDSSSLSVRIAVEEHTELGEQLFRRYVASLPEQGARAAELLNTVQTYLAERRSVPAAARILSVHQNTVRYRLERYQTLTGANFADTDVLVEIWWALEYATIRPAAAGSIATPPSLTSR